MKTFIASRVHLINGINLSFVLLNQWFISFLFNKAIVASILIIKPIYPLIVQKKIGVVKEY
ncbi:MAG: hypothetical protein ACOVO1_05855 [Chitinophagaceae bacterium]